MVSSKQNEQNRLSLKRFSKHSQGCKIYLMEMLQAMSQYNEVYTNSIFENIPTMQLELRAGTEIKRHQNLDEDNQDSPEDSFSHLCIAISVRKHLKLPNVRQMKQRELEIIEGSKEATVSMDKISKFSPQLINKVGIYY